MANANIARMLRRTKNTIVKHGPEILTALGICGLIGAGIKAVHDTPKALDIIAKEKERRKTEEAVQEKKLPRKDIFKLCWKIYLPSVLMTVFGVFCILFARRIDAKRTAALATAYKLSEEALSEFKEKTREEIGEKKLQKIEDGIYGDEMVKNPVKDIWKTGDGDSLYYDCYSHTYFRSSRTALERALLKFKMQIDSDEYVDPNDWEYAIHLPPMDNDIASLGGWNNKHKRDLDLVFSYHEADNGEPCGYVKLNIKPDINYKNLYC